MVELGLALLQPQGCWWRQRQLPEQGQGAGGTAQVRAWQLQQAELGAVREWPGFGNSQGLAEARGRLGTSVWQGLELDGAGWREGAWHIGLWAWPGAQQGLLAPHLG